MYSILVLGSDWFSTSVIRTIRQANYKQHKIKSITAATKESFLNQKVSSVEYERYIYDQKTRPLFPLACEKLNIPIIPYDGSNERYQYVSWNIKLGTQSG